MSDVVKKALLVGLVILLVVIGIPILLPGMGAASCVDCDSAVAVSTCTVAVLSVLTMVLALLFQLLLRTHRELYPELLRAVVFERPPQLVAPA